jgi:hypothetical protein
VRVLAHVQTLSLARNSICRPVTKKKKALCTTTGCARRAPLHHLPQAGADARVRTRQPRCVTLWTRLLQRAQRRSQRRQQRRPQACLPQLRGHLAARRACSLPLRKHSGTDSAGAQTRQEVDAPHITWRAPAACHAPGASKCRVQRAEKGDKRHDCLPRPRRRRRHRLPEPTLQEGTRSEGRRE